MIIETLSAHGVEALVEACAPLAQGATIVEPHVVKAVQVETPGPLHRLVLFRSDEHKRRTTWHTSW